MRHLAIAGSLTLCLALAGCKGDPTTPEYWAKKLDAKSKKEKIHSVEELRNSKHLGPAMYPMLHSQLESEKSPEVKAAIARILGEQKDVSGIDALTGAIDLGSTDSDVRTMNKEIATALGEIGNAKATPALVKLLSTKDNYTIIAAIEALGQLHAKDAFTPINDIATNDSIETFITKKALIALGELGDPRAVPTLVKAMFKERKGVSFYMESSFALYQLGAPAADALVPIAEGKDKEITAWAASNGMLPAALTAKSAQVLGDLHDLRAEKALLEMLNFKEERIDIQLFVRMRAADALGRSRSAAGAKAMAEMVSETEPTARQVYAWSISRIGGREALPKLIAASSKGSWDARNESLKAIAMLGDEREVAVMEKFSKDEAKTFEAECKSDDYGGGKECADAAAMSAASKKHEESIANFAKALEAGKACKADATCWAKKLDDPTLVVRERAAYEVGRSGNGALIGELTKRLREKDLDARLAIIQGADWLIHDSKDAMKGAQAALPDLQKQLGEERGKTEFVKVNEDLRRLAVKMQRG